MAIASAMRRLFGSVRPAAALPDESSSRAASRKRAILQGLFSGSIARVLAILVSLVNVPLTVRFLGPERYGVWITISTTVAMLGVLDLGIANTLTTLISQAFADGDRQKARTYSATAFWMTGALAAIVGTLGVLAWSRTDWQALLHLSTPAITQQARLAALFAFLSFVVNLPLSIIAKLLAGYQEVKTANYLNSASSLAGLLGILVVIHLHGGLALLAGIFCGSITLTNLIAALWLFLHHKRWLLPLPQAISRHALRALTGVGLAFFIIQLNGIVVFSSDNFVIAHYLGPRDVTPYSIVWRLTGYAAILQTVLFPSLWPAYSEAYHRGDLTWVRRTFWTTAKATMALSVVAAIGILLFGRIFIRVWAGPLAVPSFLLLALMCLWTTMSAAMNLQACLMAAVHRIRLQAFLSIFAAILNLWLSILLVHRIGSAGVILATILAHIAVLVVPQTIITHRILYPPTRNRQLAGASS